MSRVDGHGDRATGGHVVPAGDDAHVLIDDVPAVPAAHRVIAERVARPAGRSRYLAGRFAPRRLRRQTLGMYLRQLSILMVGMWAIAAGAAACGGGDNGVSPDAAGDAPEA